MSDRSNSSKRNEQIAAVISLSDLGYKKPTWDDARALVKTVNRDSAFIVLAQFNLFLAVSAIQSNQNRDVGIRRWAQERLIANIISEQRLQEIREKIGGDTDLLDRILVHRGFVMAALRLAAAHSPVEGGNMLSERDDFDVIGELALTINGITEPDSAELSPCDIAARLVPSRELENVPDLGLTLARIERMLSIHLPKHTNLEIARRAEQVFAFVTNGFNFESFRDMTLALYAYYSQLDLQKVLADQSITYLNPVNPGQVVKPEILDKFLRLMAVEVADVPAFLGDDVPDERLLLDFTRFREKPFWRFQNGAYLCIDAAFVMEKLAEGTYWWLLEGQGPRDDPDADARRQQFSSLWGYVFEDYVDEQLRYAHKGNADAIRRQPYYAKPNEEAFDYAVVTGSELIAVQCKGNFLSIGAKYSGDCPPFLQGLNGLFGMAPRAAIEQLIRNLTFVFGKGGGRRAMMDLPVADVRAVYPLAIVQEPALGFWLVAKLLAEPFVQTVAGMAWRPEIRVRSVVFMTIEELEIVAPYINAGEFTLAELLREKLDMDPGHMLSLEQFLSSNFLKARGLARRRNELVAATLEEVKDGFLARMEAGVYR